MEFETGGKIDGYIELKFGPRWKYIAVVRSFIQSFLALSFESNTRADQVAMAASELLENAVKYASRDDIQISMDVITQGEKLRISVSNSATTEAVALLKAAFDKASQGDPQEAYVSLMKEAATRQDGKSQLGLARIRYETGLSMSLKTDENTVTINLKTQ